MEINLKDVGLFEGWQTIQAVVNTRHVHDHAKLFALFERIGLVVDRDMYAAGDSELTWVCEAIYWQNRAEERASQRAEASQRAHLLAEECARLKVENAHLRTALTLEHEYAAEAHTRTLGGPKDQPE